MKINNNIFKNIIIFIILINILKINSQIAIDDKAYCEKYIGNTVCDKFLFNTDSIYVTSPTTQAEANSTVVGLLSILKLVTKECQTSSTFRLICNQNFQPCVEAPLPTNTTDPTMALAVRPCRESCEFGNQLCGTGSYLKCDPTYTDYPSILRFPFVSNVYDLTKYGGADNFTIECLNIDTMKAGDLPSNYIPNNDTVVVEQTCVEPLIYRNSSTRVEDEKLGYIYLTETSDCLLPCPISFFTPKQWRDFKNLASASGVISFVCVFFNVLTYGILNRNHDRHTVGILCLSFSLWICMLSDLIVASSEDYSLVCPEPGRFARQKDSRCAANGVIFQWGAVSTTMFWSAMAVDLYLVIKKKSPTIKVVKIFVSCIFGLTVIFSIMPIFWKEYGYGFGGVGCWIMSNKFQNIFFWGPLTTCIFIGTASICLIIYEIFTIFKNVGRGVTDLIKINIRPFLIVFCIFTEYVYLFIYHFWVEHNTDKFYTNIQDWVICVQTSPNGDGSACPLPNAIPYSAQFIFLLFLRLLGIEVLIFYGVNTRTAKIWKDSILVNNKYFKAIRSKITTLSHFGATSSTRAANTNTNSNLSNLQKQNSEFDTSQMSVELSKNTKGFHDMDDDL